MVDKRKVVKEERCVALSFDRIFFPGVAVIRGGLYLR